MTNKPNEKTEIKVVLEPQDSTSKYILVALILVLSGLLFAILAGGGAESFLSSNDDDIGVGNCGDGIDNDKGGQADRDDPDCYANPEVWEGYDPSRTEANRDNDPPGGRP